MSESKVPKTRVIQLKIATIDRLSGLRVKSPYFNTLESYDSVVNRLIKIYEDGLSAVLRSVVEVERVEPMDNMEANEKVSKLLRGIRRN